MDKYIEMLLERITAFTPFLTRYLEFKVKAQHRQLPTIFLFCQPFAFIFTGNTSYLVCKPILFKIRFETSKWCYCARKIIRNFAFFKNNFLNTFTSYKGRSKTTSVLMPLSQLAGVSNYHLPLLLPFLSIVQILSSQAILFQIFL